MFLFKCHCSVSFYFTFNGGKKTALNCKTIWNFSLFRVFNLFFISVWLSGSSFNFGEREIFWRKICFSQFTLVDFGKYSDTFSILYTTWYVRIIITFCCKLKFSYKGFNSIYHIFLFFVTFYWIFSIVWFCTFFIDNL